MVNFEHTHILPKQDKLTATELPKRAAWGTNVCSTVDLMVAVRIFLTQADVYKLIFCHSTNRLTRLTLYNESKTQQSTLLHRKQQSVALKACP